MMNKVLEEIKKGDRIAVVSGDRFTGKTTSILDAAKATPDKQILIISLSPRDATVISNSLHSCKNVLSKDYHSVVRMNSVRGFHPDIIIIDDFSHLNRIPSFDGVELQMAINYIKRENTQLIKVG